MWILIFLMAASVWDILKRKIPVIYLIAGTITALFALILSSEIVWGEILLGGITGIAFFLLSKYTKESIGYGDSWMIFILGITVGVWKLMVILGIAFLAAIIAAGIGIMERKITKKSRIPFYPFLLIGYLGVWRW